MSLKDLCRYLYKEPDRSSLQSHNQLHFLSDTPFVLFIHYILLPFLLVFKAFHLAYIYDIVAWILSSTLDTSAHTQRAQPVDPPHPSHSLLQSNIFQNVTPLRCPRRNLPTIPPLPSVLPNRHNRHDGQVHQRNNKQQRHTPKHPNWNNQRGKCKRPPIQNYSTTYSLRAIIPLSKSK